MLIPHRNRVLVKLYASERQKLFETMIKRNDGSFASLTIGYEWNDERLDASYAQNVSVGEIVGVGSEVPQFRIGDTAIIDYLVDSDKHTIIEQNEEFKILSVKAKCLYHKDDAPREILGRRRYRKGEYKDVPQLYGALRGDLLIANEPYLFLEHGESVINTFSKRHFHIEEQVSIVERKVLAAYDGAPANAGEVVVIQDSDVFDRTIGDQKISTIFSIDIKVTKHA